MAENLKKETVKGVAWSAVEKFSTGGVIFITNIILARLLSPDDFGLLAVITIFVQIAQTFIDSGFSNALIQKKDRNQIDYSTIFFFNLAISILFYIILWFSAPLVAKFFANEKLVALTRVVGLNFVIGALVAVHRTRLTILLQFKKQSQITLVSSCVAAVVSITLAYNEFGVWSLVFLTIINISLQTILFFVLIKWHPSLVFSIKAFRGLFSYSSNLLGASLINILYKNIYPIVIGKIFSPKELGYFNRADTFAQYPPHTIGSIVSRVAFPIFSRLQDDNVRLRQAYSKYITYTSLIIFPIMVGCIVMAHPLILTVLKERWLPMVPLFQILCLDWMTEHLSSINLNILYVKGRSDLALRLEIIKKIIALIIFIVSLNWGIIGVCWGRVMYGVIAVYLNSFYTKTLIGMSIIKQVSDIIGPLVQAFAMGVIVFFYQKIVWLEGITNLMSCVIVGIISYITILFFTNKGILKDIAKLVKHKGDRI